MGLFNLCKDFVAQGAREENYLHPRAGPARDEGLGERLHPRPRADFTRGASHEPAGRGVEGGGVVP